MQLFHQRMWIPYIKTMVDPLFKNKGSMDIDLGMNDSISTKIVKADLNGSRLKVVNAMNADLIGIKGYVLKETQRTFVIITESNTPKTITKQGAVF